MGYFDRLAESFFQELPDGRWAFYPSGYKGKGRLIPDRETKDSTHREVRRLLITTHILGLPLGLLHISYAALAAAVTAIVVTDWLWIRAIANKLPKCDIPASRNEMRAKTARILPDSFYWFFGTISAFMLIMAFYFLANPPRPLSDSGYFILFMASCGLFGIATSIHHYRIKKSYRSTKGA